MYSTVGDIAPEKAMAGFSRYTSCGKVQKGMSKTDPGSDEGGTGMCLFSLPFVSCELMCLSWFV